MQTAAELLLFFSLPVALEISLLQSNSTWSSVSLWSRSTATEVEVTTEVCWVSRGQSDPVDAINAPVLSEKSITIEPALKTKC